MATKKHTVASVQTTTPTKKPAPRLVQKPAQSPEDLVGLINKYLVLKKEWDVPSGRWVQKETACFVLSPHKPDPYGAASCKALLAYAREIRATNPRLAQDLRNWVASVHACNYVTNVEKGLGA